MTASTTQQWLERYQDGVYAFTLVFDGIPLGYTTSEDVAGVRAAFAAGGSPWADFAAAIRPGLQIQGEIAQAFQLFEPDIKASSLDFNLVDDEAENFTLNFLRAGYGGFGLGDRKTWLTQDLEAGTTTDIAVKDVTQLTSSGHVNIGHERIAYASVDTVANTLIGITRGVNAITENEAGAGFAPAHRITENTTPSDATAPEASEYPSAWKGRLCTLILHHKDPLLGTWHQIDRARRVWTGRISKVSDGGDGSFKVSAKSIIGDLARPVMANQWSAALAEGMALAPIDSVLWLTSDAGATYSLEANLNINEQTSHDELARKINDQLATWQDTGAFNAGDTWNLELTQVDWSETPVYRFTLNAPTSTPTPGELVHVGLSKKAWALLGFDYTGSGGETSPGGFPVLRWPLLVDSGATTVLRVACPKSPIVHAFHIGQWILLTPPVPLNDELGLWVNGTPIPSLEAAVNGVIDIDGQVYAVFKDGATLQFQAMWDKFAQEWSLFAPHDAEWGKVYRLGEVWSAPRAKQIYKTSGLAGTELLRLLLSTGTAGYNSATYDTLDGSLGVAMPYSLVDVDSFLRLDDAEIDLCITKPTPFYELLEPFLALAGRYMVWRSTGATTQPKLTVVEPAFESAFLAAWTLDDSNKGRPDDRAKTEYSAEGLVNRVEVKYGYDESGESTQTAIFNDLKSQSDHAERSAVKVDAKGVKNVEALLPKLVAPIVAYFSRPLALITRSIDASLIRMAPGDAVAITDPSLLNAATGNRGETVYCWCLAVSFDFQRGVGSCQLVYLPTRDPSRVGMFGPSALVDSYNAGTKEVTCNAHRFSDAAAGDDVDASRFVVGDAVMVRPFGVSGAGLAWSDEVAAVAGNVVTLLTGDAGVYDSSYTYVLEYDDIGSVSNLAQLYSDFMADAVNHRTSEGKAYQIGADPDAYAIGSASPSYQLGFTADGGADWSADEPVSAHKARLLADSINALLGFRTSPTYVNQWFVDPLASSAPVSFGLDPITVLLWTCWVPFYGHVNAPANRKLKVVVRGKGGALLGVDYTAQYRVVSTPTPVRGYGDLPVVRSEVTFDVTGATPAKSGDLDLEPVLSPAGAFGLRGTWISVYVNVPNDYGHGLSYLHISEAPL